MAKRGRYLIGQKISDARIERILLAYAEGQTAAEFIRHARATMRKPPAEKTVYQIFRLVRKRLRETGVHFGEFWLEIARDWPDVDGGNQPRHYYLKHDGERRIAMEIARRRGLTKNNRDHMIGEFIGRVCFPFASAQAFLAEIHKVIRVCGKLNEPVRNVSLYAFHNNIRGFKRLLSESREEPARDIYEVQAYQNFDERNVFNTEWRLRAEKRRLAKERRKPCPKPTPLEESRRSIVKHIAARALRQGLD